MNDPLPLHEAEQALQFLNADMPRDDWFRIAAALKDEYGAAGWELFDSWSQTGSGYNARSCKDTWRSAKAGHVTIGTVIKLATDAGWQRAPIDDAQREQLKRKHDRLRATRAEIAANEAEHEIVMRAQLAAACGLLLRRDCLSCTPSDFGEHAYCDPNAMHLHAYLTRKRVSGVGCFIVRAVRRLLIDNPKHSVRVIDGLVQPDDTQSKDVSVFRLSPGDLLVPLYQAGKVVSVQRIDADGGKFFPKFTPKKGSYLLLGEPAADKPLGFAEGYATGATVHDLMGWPVVVCFDAGNLLPVAESLKDLPRSETVWLADNDAPNEKNGKQAGRLAAEQAKKKLGGVIALPSFEGG